MTAYTVARAREALAEILNRVAYGKERIILTRHGKAVVAVIPIDDLALLEQVEDDLPVERARQVLSAEKPGHEMHQ